MYIYRNFEYLSKLQFYIIIASNSLIILHMHYLRLLQLIVSATLTYVSACTPARSPVAVHANMSCVTSSPRTSSEKRVRSMWHATCLKDSFLS